MNEPCEIELAAWRLERIVKREPLYRPAAFALAYLRLRQGDTNAAERLFAELTEPYHKEAELKLADAKEKWPRRGLEHRLVWKIKPIARWMVPWLDEWKHIRSLVIGGELYEAERDWTQFDEQLARSKDAKNPLREPQFTLYLEGFTNLAGIRDLVRKAAAVRPGNAVEARGMLDWFFRFQAPSGHGRVSALDRQLQHLEFRLTTARIDGLLRDHNLGAGASTDERCTPDLELLRQSRIVETLQSFQQKLEELGEHWLAAEWDRCQRILRDLRDLTRAPDDDAATSRFMAGSRTEILPDKARLRRFKQWLSTKLMPGFGLLDSWRNTFRTGFFLESEYYLALCRFQSLTNAGICTAMKQAKVLHTQILAGAVPEDIDPKRYAELRVLAQCLEINAILRILDGDESDPAIKDNALDAQGRWYELEKSLIPRLPEMVSDATHSPMLRATVASTLGLIEGHQRRPAVVDRTEKMMKEMVWLRQALELERSADACLYLAATLADVGRGAEARRYLAEALQLCPLHAGARTLHERLTG